MNLNHKAMKKLFILLALIVVFANYSNGQERDKWLHSDTLISGTDTMYVDTLNMKYEYVYIVIRDTGTVFTDSIKIETLDPVYKVWTPIGVQNPMNNEVDTLAIAGAGQTRRFLILDPMIYIVRATLINQEYVAGRRTFITILGKTY